MGKGCDNSNYGRDPPAALGSEGVAVMHTSGLRSIQPRARLPPLLPRRAPRSDEGSRGTGLVQPPRAAEKLLRAQPAPGLGGGRSRAASIPGA